MALAPTTPALSGARLPYLAAGYGFFAMVSGTNMAAPLYGVYARELGFSPLVLMLIFATYIAVLLPSLLLFGPLSDAVGRRWVIVGGLLLAAGATAIFLAAESVAWLFAARVVQGVAVGLCSGALTAALVETQPHGDRRHASLVATLALSIGAAPGLLLAGFLAEWAPWPLGLCWLVCMVALLLAAALALSLPNVRVGRWRPRRPSVPHEIRGPFWVAAAVASLSWVVASIFASIVPSYVSLSLDTDNLALLGAVSALFFVCSGVAQIKGRGISHEAGLLGGIVVMVAGLALLIGSGVFGSVALLLAATTICGSGQGITHLNSMVEVNRIAPVRRHAEIVSAFYVVSYGAVAICAVGCGLLATLWRLVPAVEVFSLAAIVACALTFGLVRRTLPAPRIA